MVAIVDSTKLSYSSRARILPSSLPPSIMVNVRSRCRLCDCIWQTLSATECTHQTNWQSRPDRVWKFNFRNSRTGRVHAQADCEDQLACALNHPNKSFGIELDRIELDQTRISPARATCCWYE